jgi:protein-S-isoprenylcysteine O-methyltransferase Ste14
MTFSKRLEKEGNWLFKRRSYFPLLILPVLFVALCDSDHSEVSVESVNYWEVFCITISFLGLIVRCITIGYVPRGTSGRNTENQKAYILNTKGIYAIVRHPLYLGNFIITLGFALFIKVWWFSTLAVLVFWLYYERIIYTEEEFLKKKFGKDFHQWAERTTAFFPDIKKWHKPDLPFSFRNVLKREYSGFFVIISFFTFLDIAEDSFKEGALIFDMEWMILFFFGLIIYLTLRTLKTKTRVLHADGR